jgi:replicative DNA helicase
MARKCSKTGGQGDHRYLPHRFFDDKTYLPYQAALPFHSIQHSQRTTRMLSFSNRNRRRKRPDHRILAPDGPVDRIPPHNLDAEQGLIASCIISDGNQILTDCIAEKIAPQYFYSPAHQLIFDAMLELQKAGKGIDEITLSDALHKGNALETIGGPAYISALVNRIEITTHVKHWRSIVREKYFLRQLIETATDTVERAYKPDDDLQHMLDDVEKKFFEISANRIANDSAQPAAKSIDEAVGLINILQKNKGEIYGVPTGFRLLDKLCFGFHGGEMIVVAARPGMGKTAIALNFIEAAVTRDAKKGGAVPTLMFSLEMPSRELAMRLICAKARVNLSRVREGFIKSSAMKNIVDAAKEYKDAPLFIDDQGGQTILEIRAKARRLVKSHKIGLIVIDYLQLINGTDNGMPREQQIAEASRSIKAMAKEFNLPVVALAQLNRKSEDENRPPRISDLRESGSIEQDADMVLIIDIDRHSRKKNKKGEIDTDGVKEDENRQEVVRRKLLIAKQRNGPTGDIPLLFHRGMTRFENQAEDYITAPEEEANPSEPQMQQTVL